MEENLCLSEDLNFSSIRVEMDDFFTVTQYIFPLLSFPEYMSTWKQTHLNNRCCYKFLWFSVTIIFLMSSSADLHEFCARGKGCPAYCNESLLSSNCTFVRQFQILDDYIIGIFLIYISGFVVSPIITFS